MLAFSTLDARTRNSLNLYLCAWKYSFALFYFSFLFLCFRQRGPTTTIGENFERPMNLVIATANWSRVCSHKLWQLARERGKTCIEGLTKRWSFVYTCNIYIYIYTRTLGIYNGVEKRHSFSSHNSLTTSLSTASTYIPNSCESPSAYAAIWMFVYRFNFDVHGMATAILRSRWCESIQGRQEEIMKFLVVCDIITQVNTFYFSESLPRVEDITLTRIYILSFQIS